MDNKKELSKSQLIGMGIVCASAVLIAVCFGLVAIEIISIIYQPGC